MKRESRHFAFGDNWADYAENVSLREIENARLGLEKLLSASEIAGKTVIDIGCGSGIHSLAFLNANCSYLEGFDFDPKSVETTKKLLSRFFVSEIRKFSIYEGDILNSDFNRKFDIVYSWGVLHHTGNLRRAIQRAGSLVQDDGFFVFAFYRKTPFCWFWKIEKWIYSKLPSTFQTPLRFMYIQMFKFIHVLRGRGSFSEFERNYKSGRGMDFLIDVHDWLGGHPYESISPFEVRKILKEEGFVEVKAFIEKSLGLMGSGCDEYVFKKMISAS